MVRICKIINLTVTFRFTDDKIIFYNFYLHLMSFYIILWNYTDQGIKNIKESPKRVNIFKSKLENVGVN